MFSPGLVGIGPFPRPLVPFGASSWPLSGPCRMGNLLGNPVKFIAQCDYLVRIGALTGVRDGHYGPFWGRARRKKWLDLADRAQRPTRGLALERSHPLVEAKLGGGQSK